MTLEELKEKILDYIRFDKPGVEKLLEKCRDYYVHDDGIIDFKNEKEWDEEYFYELFPATRKNFSREKVEELLKVHDKIRGKVKEDNSFKSDYSTQKTSFDNIDKEKTKEEFLNCIRFDESGIEKLLRKCEVLYVTDDGIIDFKNEEEWDEKYFYELFPATRKNFSREKVEELLKVHDKIRGKVKEDNSLKSDYSMQKTSFDNIDKEKIKEEFLNYIRFDKSGIEKLLRKCEVLYVTDDRIFDFKNEKEWDEEYFYELFPATRKNFSREKVEELVKVHDKIRGKVKEDNSLKSDYSTPKISFDNIDKEKTKEEAENYHKEKTLKKIYVSDNIDNTRREGFSFKFFNYEITIKKYKKNENRRKK